MGKMRIYNKRRTKWVDVEIKDPKDAKVVMDILAKNVVSFVFHFADAEAEAEEK